MSPPVVIAGAGPVGLALACALGHHGVAWIVLAYPGEDVDASVRPQ